MGKLKQESLAKLEELRRENAMGGGIEAIEKQHTRGKLTAWERVDLLVDPGTFNELGSAATSSGVQIDSKTRKTPRDGALIGTGKIDGRPVVIYASDFTVQGGSVANQHAVKIDRTMEYAAKWGVPLINLLDSSGGRLNQELGNTSGFKFLFEIESLISGVVPQINVLMGPCVAGQAYYPILNDFLIMPKRNSWMWLGGPRMVKAITTEEMMKTEDVGGGEYHMKYTGSCHLVAEDDQDAIRKARKLLSYLPQNYREKPQICQTGDDPHRQNKNILDLIPDDLDAPYDVHKVIAEIVDNGELFEIQDEYAKQITMGFCRLNGQSVGIIANNPAEPGSPIENNACDKQYRFIRVLDAYNIPLVTLIDTPPIVPGDEWESQGLIRHVGKLIYSYSIATVPKVSLIMRRAYADAGSIAMGGSKSFGVDFCFAWPMAELAVEASQLDMSGKMGVDPDAYTGYLGKAREKASVFEVAKRFTTAVVDEIIDPADTRKKIIEALQMTEHKQENLPPRAKKHGTPPT